MKRLTRIFLGLALALPAAAWAQESATPGQATTTDRAARRRARAELKAGAIDAQQALREGHQEAREAVKQGNAAATEALKAGDVQGAREAIKSSRRDARDARREGHQEAHQARQEGREAAQEIRAAAAVTPLDETIEARHERHRLARLARWNVLRGRWGMGPFTAHLSAELLVHARRIAYLMRIRSLAAAANDAAIVARCDELVLRENARHETRVVSIGPGPGVVPPVSGMPTILPPNPVGLGAATNSGVVQVGGPTAAPLPGTVQ